MTALYCMSDRWRAMMPWIKKGALVDKSRN
jgi:hypothetical protein